MEAIVGTQAPYQTFDFRVVSFNDLSDKPNFYLFGRFVNRNEIKIWESNEPTAKPKQWLFRR